MDGRDFDYLARSLASAGSRRRFLKGLVGGAAALGAGLVGLQRGDAACPPAVGSDAV